MLGFVALRKKGVLTDGNSSSDMSLTNMKRVKGWGTDESEKQKRLSCSEGKGPGDAK